MANDLIITPENIQAVIVQYKTNQNFPNTDAPVILVEIYDGIAPPRFANIALSEMQTYIKMLQLKANIANDGRVVIAEQPYNGVPPNLINSDTYTIIHLGLPSLPQQDGSITLITPNGTSGTQITPMVNVTDITANVISFNNLAFGFQFTTLPIINGDIFENDYDVVSNNGAVVPVFADIETHLGVDYWNVRVLYQPDGLTGDIITFTAKKLRANFFISNRGDSTVNNINGVTNIGGDLIAVNGDGFVPQNDIIGGTGLFLNQIPNGQTSAFRLRGNTSSGSALINVDITAASAIDIVAQVSGSNKSIYTTTNEPSTGTYDINADYEYYSPDTNPLAKSISIIVSGATSAPPPVGVAATAAAEAGSAAGICTAPIITVYTDNGDITTGKTVFTDLAMTTPLAGFDFIVNSTGVVYAIDNVTGLVGAPTGGTCAVPITGKNTFVISAVNNHLDVDGTDYGAKLAGQNYNIIIKSGSIITNNSGGAKTFTFYQTPPFVPPNITAGSGTPILVANGGTYTLPNDITNYNYLRIS